MTRTEFNPAKLGAFVIGAMLLAVIAIILWGPLNNLWQKKYVIFFDESAKGLDVGATVRLNGVAIGNVNSIDLFYDQNSNVYSAVIVQLDRTKVKRISKNGQSFDDMLRGKDLSAQLGISGVVSLKLDVALEVGKPRDGDYRHWNYREYREFYGDIDWIPARQSTIAKVLAKLEEVLNGPGITNLIGSVGKLLDDTTTNHLILEATTTIKKIGVLSTTVNRFILTNQEHFKMALSNLTELSSNAGPELKQTLATLDSAAVSFQSNITVFGTSADAMSTNFDRLSTNLDARLAELSVLLRGAAPLPPQAAETLRSLQDTLESLQRLIDYVERHPDSVLRGRAKEK